MAVLEIKDGTFGYDEGWTIFHDVSFSIEPGEVFTILGPNGAGKSTLLSCLAGLNELTSGTVLFEGRERSSLTSRDVARIVGFVPQVISSVYAYPVMDYVVMGRAPYIGMMRKPSVDDYEMAAGALEGMGILHLAHRNYNELSGGERQQVAIARILVQNPKLVMLDEPTSALDFGNQIKVMHVARRLSRQGYSVVLTTHTPDHAIMLNGTVGILDRAGNMTVGSVDEIVTEEALSETYQTDVAITYVEAVRRRSCLALFSEDD